jgi:hypothetical protein
MADAMPFQQHHEARVFGRDLNDVLTDELLLNVRANIQVGDEVVICGYADETMKRLMQFARVRVYSISKDGVIFKIDGEVTGIPLAEDEPEPAKMEPKYKVVRGFHCYNVVDIKTEAILESLRTKAEAEVWRVAHDVAA